MINGICSSESESIDSCLSPFLLQRISCHPSAERPMLKRLCRSFIDLVFVLDQLDCTLVDIILYPDDAHQKNEK